MPETIKKHWDVFLAIGIGLVLVIVGLMGIVGVVSWPRPALGDVATTVEVTATVQEWLTFTSSATSVTLSPDLVDTGGVTHIASSSDFKLIVGTNSADGYSITVADSNSGIKDNGNTIQLTGATNTIAAGTDGYGIQATSADMTIQTLYNWATTTEDVGRVSSTAAKMATDASPGTSQGAWVKVKAACDSLQPSGSYTDVITFTAVPTP